MFIFILVTIGWLILSKKSVKIGSYGLNLLGNKNKQNHRKSKCCKKEGINN
jgi:hypothetical protein